MGGILLVGDVMLDHWLIGSVSRMSPEDGSVPVLAVEREIWNLGGAANVGVNLVNLGFHVSLFSKLGAGLTSGTGFFNLIPEGMHVSQLGQHYGAPNVCSVKTRGVEAATGRQVFRYDVDAVWPIDSAVEQRLMSSFEGDAGSGECSAIVVSDYDKQFLNEYSRKHIVEVANKHRLPVFVDCKPAAVPHYRGATCLKINFPSAIKLAESCVHPALARSDPFEAAIACAKFIAKQDFDTVVVTMGSLGAVTVGPLKTVEIRSTTSVSVASVVGAGDAFLAACVWGWLSQSNRTWAAHVANELVGRAVQRPGTVTVIKDDLTGLQQC